VKLPKKEAEIRTLGLRERVKLLEQTTILMCQGFKKAAKKHRRKIRELARLSVQSQADATSAKWEIKCQKAATEKLQVEVASLQQKVTGLEREVTSLRRGIVG
jgi:predicted RNase H-like nuclease (RuvC/YqgF family)